MKNTIHELFKGNVDGIYRQTACRLPQILEIAEDNGWQVVEYNPLRFTQYLLNVGKYEEKWATIIFRRGDNQIFMSFSCRRSAAQTLAGYLHTLQNGNRDSRWLNEMLGRIQLYCMAGVIDVETLESVDAFARNELLDGFDWNTINADTIFANWNEEEYNLELTTQGGVNFSMLVCRADIMAVKAGRISVLDLPVHVIVYHGL